MIIYKIAEEEGWSFEQLLTYCLKFISDNGDKESLLEYLDTIKEFENNQLYTEKTPSY